MAQVAVLFDVPKWIAAGIRTGRLRLFGGVVRNNAGHVVRMLKEGSKTARFGGSTGAAGLVLAAAALGYGIYRRFGSKAKVLDALEAVERAMLTYASAAQAQRLTVDHIRGLASELQNLMTTMASPEFRDANFALDAEAANKLREFYASLRTFNVRLRGQGSQGLEVPQLVATPDLRELAHSINEQLIFQHTLLPAPVPATQEGE